MILSVASICEKAKATSPLGNILETISHPDLAKARVKAISIMKSQGEMASITLMITNSPIAWEWNSYNNDNTIKLLPLFIGSNYQVEDDENL